MAKRGAGPGISVKMILTTTLLILLTIVGFGVLNVLNIRKVYDDATQAQMDLYRAERIENNGERFTPVLGRALEPYLINRGLVSYCQEEAELKCGPPLEEGKHPPVLPETAGKVGADAWQTAQTTWLANAKTNTGDVLIRFDQSGPAGRYRVFAYPVFSNEEPTAANATAAEAPPNRQGYVLLGYDLAPLTWFAADADRKKVEASTDAAVRTGAVGALFVLIGTVLAIFQGLSISRPIKQLAWKADQIARGDLDARVDVRTRDEIGVLGENFNFMADQIVLLLQQTAEKARIEQELEVAKAIQETLVPPSDPVDKGTFKFAGYYQPAAQTGGDWWSWHDLSHGKVLVVIGDVTGHGVPSAMITAAAKSACDVSRVVYGDDVAVTKLLEIMNLAIYESAKRNFVMTCFASVIDTRRRTITYANAGHNFPYLFRPGADRKGEFGSLMIRGNRLGDLRESTYESKTTELVPGDILVWYTDGIVECESEAGEEYGEKRFRSSVRRAAALDAGEMRDAIVSDAMSFFGEAQRKDDISMVIGRIY